MFTISGRDFLFHIVKYVNMINFIFVFDVIIITNSPTRIFRQNRRKAKEVCIECERCVQILKIHPSSRLVLRDGLSRARVLYIYECAEMLFCRRFCEGLRRGGEVRITPAPGGP